MSQDLRLYSLTLAVVLMLWVGQVRADYYGCPVLEVPVQLTGSDVWASYDNPDDASSEDYRQLYPYNTSITSMGYIDTIYECSLELDSGTYYDGANHLWVLDDDLTCDFVSDGSGGDFRAGEY